MITIGIRAAPKVVTFAIYNSDADQVLNVEEIKIPAALTTPDALKYLRSNLLDVLREFKVNHAGIRATEPTARHPSTERIQIEGVIQETFASSDLTAYYVGHISSISSRLGIRRNEFKPLVEGDADWKIENWADLSNPEREAVLCAIGAVNA